MNFLFVWLTGALIFLLFEIAHPGLFLFLSFCFGATASALTSWLDYGFFEQAVVFFGTTFCAGILLSYWLKKHGQFKKGIDSQSNVYALVGKKGQVIKALQPDSFGFVKINGEIWMARSFNNSAIKEGSIIEVLSSKGAHLIVTNAL